jgi:SOS response regulatory protein OraA/RecX
MSHVKWFLALIVCVAAAAVTTFYATKQYTSERTTALLAEASIARNTTYAALASDIANGEYDAAREKLRRLFDFEVDDIRRARAVLEDGYFASANRSYLDQIDRYLASPNDGR